MHFKRGLNDYFFSIYWNREFLWLFGEADSLCYSPWSEWMTYKESQWTISGLTFVLGRGIYNHDRAFIEREKFKALAGKGEG